MFKKGLGNALLVWAGILVLMALAYQSQNFIGKNPILRKRLDRIEPFQNVPEPVQDNLESIAIYDPADASLENLRQPYALLQDTFSLSSAPPPRPTSAACYNADFQTRLEKTGNYKQLTNNYKRGTPDSCSEPLHEMTSAIYKVTPLP